ncbi:MAG: FCD domain-containing protein [Bacteroidota bacterium]
MKIENKDLTSIVETWVLLEIQSAKLAAIRRTEQDLSNIKKALKIYTQKVQLNKQAINEDQVFHLKISEASKNEILQSLISILRSEIIRDFPQLDRYKNKTATAVIDEHEIILKHIVTLEPERAEQAMRQHLQDMYHYSQHSKSREGNGSG